jgi:hypothetical protein
MADSKQRGIALHAVDGFLAATARAHNQTLVTRNVKDFAPFGLPLLNPWDGGWKPPFEIMFRMVSCEGAAGRCMMG